MKLTLKNATVLRPEGLELSDLSFADGVICGDRGPEVDLVGCTLLPGIVDLHGDGFERHLAPRRGAMKDLSLGLASVEAELAANGITTAVLAQFWSWEGGMRSREFAQKLLEALEGYQSLGTDLKVQLRFEYALLSDYPAFTELQQRFQVPYVVFNDHLPHKALAAGKKPPRLTGQALKSGRSPEAHLALMQRLHADMPVVEAKVTELAAQLTAQGVRLGSHDDASAEARATWRARQVNISEFPETLVAAQAAHEAGDAIVLGAPNVVRGGSHSGNVSAVSLVKAGYCDALASDYHYPAPRQAAMILAEEIGLAAAWRLVSERPAEVLGLSDRGRLEAGKRADLLVLDSQGRIGGTIAGGQITYLSGEVAQRFLDRTQG